MGARPFLREHRSGSELLVTVIPRSSHVGMTGVHGDRIKIKLSAPPVDGKANAQLIAYLAKILGCKRSAIAITSGEGAKNKSVIISGLKPSEIIPSLDGILEND